MILHLLNGTLFDLPFEDIEKAKRWLIDNEIFETAEYLYFTKVESDAHNQSYMVVCIPTTICLKLSDTVDKFRLNWQKCTNTCLLHFAIAHITHPNFSSLCANPHPLVVDEIFKQPFQFLSFQRDWLNQNPSDQVVSYLLHEKPTLIDLQYMVENTNQQAIRHCFNALKKVSSLHQPLFQHTTDVEIIDYLFDKWKKKSRRQITPSLPYNPHPHAVQLMVRDMGVQEVMHKCTDAEIIQLGLTECENYFLKKGKISFEYLCLGMNPSDMVVDYVLSKPFDIIRQFQQTFIYNSNPRACEFWMKSEIYTDDRKWYKIYRHIAVHPYENVVKFMIDKMKDDPFDCLKKMIDAPSELYGGGRLESVMAILISTFSAPLVKWLFTNEKFLQAIPPQDVSFFHWKAVDALSKCDETSVEII